MIGSKSEEDMTSQTQNTKSRFNDTCVTYLGGCKNIYRYKNECFQYFKERLQEFVTLRNGGKVEKSH